MSKKKIQPRLVFADNKGNIYDHPDLLMLAQKGTELVLPRPDELIPLPQGSDLYLLPKRAALGFDPQSGRIENEVDAFAVAAFVCPGYTLSATAAYERLDEAPALPLFSYGAVGFADDRFWVCAKQVDQDRRQVFTNVPQEKIESQPAHSIINPSEGTHSWHLRCLRISTRSATSASWLTSMPARRP